MLLLLMLSSMTSRASSCWIIIIVTAMEDALQVLYLSYIEGQRDLVQCLMQRGDPGSK